MGAPVSGCAVSDIFITCDISLHTVRPHPRRPNFWHHRVKRSIEISLGNPLNKTHHGIIFFLQLAGSVEVLKSDLGTLGHGLLTLTNPDTGVEELLVGLVSTVGVTDHGLEVVLLALDEVPDTGQVGVLHVSVDVDLDDTVADSLLVLLLGGTGATVEDEEDGLVLLGAESLLDVGLVLGEQLGVETDVTGLVDTVNVTEASGDGEVGADGRKSFVDSEDVLGLSVKGVVVNILVVDTILLTTGDTDLLEEC